ncbi:MAG TPA: D-alanyl-lipoteichoic acid biosynthesis protein DltB [Chthoniobacterales bacterium]|nr:D-alanyl-lipoteichoic acid biosynthesis protein DltB [Chthoniobacterales bacterium]
MIPYSSFTFFALLLYLVVPTIILGLFGRTGWRWALFATAVMLVVQYHNFIKIGPWLSVREVWLVAAFAIWQWVVIRIFAGVKSRRGWTFYGAIAASLLPLAATKLFPLVSAENQFGFLGISYVTFRALDVVFCLRDGVISELYALDLFGFLFFFPTISAGPIDRFNRFSSDWKMRRSRTDFLTDLDEAVHRIFRGFFYKFILAALIKEYWVDLAASGESFGALVSYMYGYSFYLFFDFAGYSAFAIALSYIFGVHTPENFQRPFLARDIRDFWNRWHITLSFWFRDHVYMRFLLAATRGNWFANKYTASVLAYFVTFGLMGVWHGLEPHYIFYGLYQAALLSGFEIFSAVDRKRRIWGTGPLWNALAIFLTFQFVCFGLLIFSGRIGAPPLGHHAGEAEKADCNEISGWVWDKHRPDAEVNVDLADGKDYLLTFSANQFRQDLADAGYGNGRHAFRIPTPPRFRDGQSHVLYLRIAGTKRELANTPKIILCPESHN